ncbi:MAG: hypothetical protein DHS20C01_25020 [marine bacterium B5-7]|nr:MAG: hypothetical protein DHS20C01_25020 [marine bacterium B5-7]
MIDQVSLPFAGVGRRDIETFYPDGNEELIGVVRQLALSCTDRVVYLHGVADSGKSHLLQGAAALARSRGQLAIYLSMGEPGVSAELIGQVNPSILICIDDVQEIATNEPMERALLDLFERTRSSVGRLLFSADHPPQGIGLKLADLATRLGSQLVYRIRPLDDDRRALAFRWAAHYRGIKISAATVEWLIRRAPRDNRSLFALLEVIDRASLDEGRRVTIPFLRTLDLD